jgi:hypothetical protein
VCLVDCELIHGSLALQKSLAQTDALVSSLQHWTAGTDVASFLQQGTRRQQVACS